MKKPREEDYTQPIRVSNIYNPKTIELIKNKNILDLGIHKGHLSNFAFSFGAKSITGIDIRIDNCELGKTIHKNIKEYAATGLDFVSCGAVIHQAKSIDLSLKATLIESK